MNWMQAAVDSLKEQLHFAKALKGNDADAIKYVRQRSTAGNAAWETVLRELGLVEVAA